MPTNTNESDKDEVLKPIAYILLNRTSNQGFFIADSLEGLHQKFAAKVEDYSQEELAEFYAENPRNTFKAYPVRLAKVENLVQNQRWTEYATSDTLITLANQDLDLVNQYRDMKKYLTQAESFSQSFDLTKDSASKMTASDIKARLVELGYKADSVSVANTINKKTGKEEKYVFQFSDGSTVNLKDSVPVPSANIEERVEALGRKVARTFRDNLDVDRSRWEDVRYREDSNPHIQLQRAYEPQQTEGLRLRAH